MNISCLDVTYYVKIWLIVEWQPIPYPSIPSHSRWHGLVFSLELRLITEFQGYIFPYKCIREGDEEFGWCIMAARHLIRVKMPAKTHQFLGFEKQKGREVLLGKSVRGLSARKVGRRLTIRASWLRVVFKTLFSKLPNYHCQFFRGFWIHPRLESSVPRVYKFILMSQT